MTPEPFCIDDIPAFLSLAWAEGWIAARWELEFLLQEFPSGCLILRDDAGIAIGFITSCVHTKSAWIGNLIIVPTHRGKGFGQLLFMAALNALHNAQCQTIWLTASKMGMGIYEKHGFNRIDTIQRWAGRGKSDDCKRNKVAESPPIESLMEIDQRVWGDNREKLLHKVINRGESISSNGGFITIQPCGESHFQLGPFDAMNAIEAEKLFLLAEKQVPKESIIYIDAPSSNMSASLIFKNNHLKIIGTTEEMYWGKRAEHHPQLLYGLATMGSCG